MERYNIAAIRYNIHLIAAFCYLIRSNPLFYCSNPL